MKYALFVFLMIFVGLAACTPTDSPAELPAPTALAQATATAIGVVLDPTASLSASVTPSPSPTPFSTPSPSLTPTRTPRPTRTPMPEESQTNRPEPTSTSTSPLAEVVAVLEYSPHGGNWDSEYAGYSDQAPFILYDDGRLLIQGELNSPHWYSQTILNQDEKCALLAQIQATGGFQVEEVYDFASFTTSEMNDYNIHLSGGYVSVRLSSGLGVERINWQDTWGHRLVPEVQAIVDLMTSYRTTTLTPYVPTSIIVGIYVGNGYLPDGIVAQEWPAELPSLEALPTYMSYDADTQFKRLLIEGEQVALFASQLDTLPGSGLFVENGQEYSLIARPLLPHENLANFNDSLEMNPLQTGCN